MNKTLLSAALVATLGALAVVPAASANTGTIQITGTVLQDTCTVTVNGSGNTVTLTPVMTTSLLTTGAVANPKTFTLNLTNCDQNAKQAQLSFKGGSHNNTDGNLKNSTSSGSAGNVEVQLLAGIAGSSPIKVNDDTNAPAVALNNGSGSTTMTAQYYATGAATAGLVSTSASITFTYQ